MLVGQPEGDDQTGAGLHGVTEGRRVHVGEPQLRRSEHDERAVLAQDAPAEPEVTLPALAVDEWPSDVEPVLEVANGDLELPPGDLRVPGDELGGLGPARETDVDVLVLAAVRSRSAPPPGKIAPADLHDHGPTSCHRG